MFSTPTLKNVLLWDTYVVIQQHLTQINFLSLNILSLLDFQVNAPSLAIFQSPLLVSLLPTKLLKQAVLRVPLVIFPSVSLPLSQSSLTTLNTIWNLTVPTFTFPNKTFLQSPDSYVQLLTEHIHQDVQLLSQGYNDQI